MGPVDESHPIYQFKVHALECEEDSYLLAAQALSAACSAAAAGTGGGAAGGGAGDLAAVEAALRPYGYDANTAPGPWWEVAADEEGAAAGEAQSQPNGGGDSDAEEEAAAAAEEEREFRALLKAQVAESWGLLSRGIAERLTAAAAAASSGDAFIPSHSAVSELLRLLSPAATDDADSPGLRLYGRLVSLCALRGVDASAPSPAAMYAEAIMLRRLRHHRARGVTALSRWAELIDEHAEALAEAEEGGDSDGGSNCGGGGVAGGGGDGNDEGEEGETIDEGEFDLEPGFRARIGEEEAEAGEVAERFADAAPGFQARFERNPAGGFVLCAAAVLLFCALCVRCDIQCPRASQPSRASPRFLILLYVFFSRRASASSPQSPPCRTAASRAACSPSSRRPRTAWCVRSRLDFPRGQPGFYSER